MNKEQQKDKIIEIVKKAIDDNKLVTYGEDDIISLESNDVDHIAEEVAENVYNFYKPIDNEPVGAIGERGISVLVTKPRRLTNQILEECAEAINENRDLHRRCEQLQAKNADLKRTNEAIQRATAQDILQQMWNWKDRETSLIADIQELADKYGVEVKLL